MQIRTDRPLMQDRALITNTIAAYWNKTSEGWRTIWGPHIHHGFYETNEALTPLQAQVKLIDKLTEMLPIKPHDHILDAGCGMGGSSIYLAKKFAVNVTGITLSRKQMHIAVQQACREKVNNVTFEIEDALSLTEFESNTFDIVWSLESCEQFYDKKLFLQNAYRLLKPGGKLMLATWCSDQDEYAGDLAWKYQRLCEAFDLPYMPTINHYRALLTEQGFNISNEYDWTTRVAKSWDIGISLANTYTFLQLLKMSGWRGFKFVRQTRMMRDAFHEQRVRYGVFIATKPE